MKEKSSENPLLSRVNILKNLSFSQLCELPDSNSEEVTIDNRIYSFNTWKEQISNHEVQVVVQCQHNFILGFSGTSALGFTKTSAEIMRDLADSELYRYI